MSGALVDLVAKGVQDAYLTGTPEVSFFRQNYKRHTNFTTKPVKLTAMGTQGANNEISLKIPNKGDLLSYVWLETPTSDTNNLIGSSSSPTVFELWIGGQMVERQDSIFMEYHWKKFLVDSNTKGCLNPTTWFPLHFFFCDNYPLPLVALQYHEVEIKIKFSSLISGSPLINYYATYILIDTVERDYFVSKNHEILIEQVQKIPVTGGTGTNVTFDLSLLNHPVKSLHWSNVSNVSYSTGDVMVYLNGTQLFDSPMPDNYFSNVQGYYHSEYYSGLLSAAGAYLKMYSFAQKANKHVPTGSCNFSRLDNAEMKIVGASPNSQDAILYAVNWNILRIKNGMAGVAFSN
jgi:hypothetical protein